MKKLGDNLRRRMGSEGSVLRRPSPITFGGGRDLRNAISAVLDLQDESGFMVQRMTLPDGTRVKTVVDGNMRRVVKRRDVISAQRTADAEMWFGFHGVIPRAYMDLYEIPCKIYLGDSILSYITSGGSIIPESQPTRTERIFGKYVNFDADSASWVDNPPALDEENGFTPQEEMVRWRAYTPIYQGTRHTGLMLALVQALAGAGRNVLDIIPTGWLSTPGKIGCIRSPDNVYWLTQLNVEQESAEMLGVELLISETPANIGSWSNDGLLTGFDAQLADAVSLGQCTPKTIPDPNNANGTIFDIHVIADVSSAFTGGRNTYLWGCCGRWQRRGEMDEKIAGFTWVSLYEENTYAKQVIFSGLYTLDILWENGVPTGSLTEISHSYWSLAGTYGRIFFISELESCRLLIPKLGATADGHGANKGVVCSCYLPDGSLETISWEGNVARAASGIGYSGYSALLSNGKYCANESLSIGPVDIVRSSGYTSGWLSSSSCGYVNKVASAYTVMFSQQSLVSSGVQTSLGYAYNPSSFQQCDGTQIQDYFFTDGRPYPNVGWAEAGTRTYSWTLTEVTGGTADSSILITETPGVFFAQSNTSSTTESMFSADKSYAIASVKYGGLKNGVVGTQRYFGDTHAPPPAQNNVVTNNKTESRSSGMFLGESVSVDDETIRNLMLGTLQLPCIEGAGIRTIASYNGIIKVSIGKFEIDEIPSDVFGANGVTILGAL